MIKRHILFLVIAILFSCKEYDKVDVDKIFKDSPTPELDMVFYELVKDFKNKLNKDIAIVDRAVNDNLNFNLDTIPIYWNKSIFPKTKFINSDSLYLNNEPNKKHLVFSKKIKHGYIEITPPYFVNPDKELLHIRVKCYSPNRIKVYHQILEKENNRYIIKEQDIIAMFNDFEMEFAKANYYDYIPYTGL